MTLFGTESIGHLFVLPRIFWSVTQFSESQPTRPCSTRILLTSARRRRQPHWATVNNLDHYCHSPGGGFHKTNSLVWRLLPKRHCSSCSFLLENQMHRLTSACIVDTKKALLTTVGHLHFHKTVPIDTGLHDMRLIYQVRRLLCFVKFSSALL